MTVRSVFDTNVILSALLFTNGQLAWLRSAWEKQLLTPIVTKETTEELLRVLAYPKFKLYKQERNDLLADFLPFTEIFVLNKNQKNDVPLCRDKNDQMFLDLAYQSNVEFLVTGDKDLLVLNSLVAFNIKTATQLKHLLESY